MNKLLTVFILILLSLTAYAQVEILRNDPKRPVDKISKDLGINQEQFVECFHNVNPAPKGITPSREHERANKDILLTCLKKANPNISNDILDKVMDSYRPEGKLH